MLPIPPLDRAFGQVAESQGRAVVGRIAPSRAVVAHPVQADRPGRRLGANERGGSSR